MAQLLLIPDPRPLDEHLGAEFFRDAPKRPGVYLMRDVNEKVLYVGKAKSLRSRLQNYRIANPDKMPRRHLKMLRQVARIEFRFAHNEAAALKNESALIRTIKPKFNRAGVWPGKTKFIVWQIVGDRLELGMVEVPEPGWQRFGPLKSSCRHLHQTLSRMLWLACNPTRAYGELPAGWAQGNIAEAVSLSCGKSAREIGARLDSYFWNLSDEFLCWLGAQLVARTHPFERITIELEFKVLSEFAAKRKNSPQLSLI